MACKKCFLLASLIVCMLVGCTQKPKETDEAELKDQIKLDLTLSSYQISEAAKFITTFEVSEDYLNEKYQWTLSNEIEVFGLFGSVLDTNRMLLFHVNKNEDKQFILQYLNEFKEAIKKSYPSEMEEEINLIDKAIILDEGTYLLFITGENAEAGAALFEEITLR